MGNTSVAIQFQSFFDELTEDEKEEELQSRLKTAASPGLSWGGRRLADDDEPDPKPDMRSMKESSYLN